jgi:type VI secretion system protein ImpL
MMKLDKIFSVNFQFLGLLIPNLAAATVRKAMTGWTILIVAAICIVAFVIYRLVKKPLSRRKKKARAKVLPDYIIELDRTWKKSLTELKQSKLRHRGNPVYALPWFLILGEKGSGKTAALQNTGLSSIKKSHDFEADMSGTKNCEWFFLKDAVILDTAGRYAIPINEKNDNEEWQHFLRLLKKSRRDEPINGLILTISAEKLGAEKDLSTPEKEELVANGREIRRKIDELTAISGTKFPVYILVTKMDRVLGMTQFSRLMKGVGKSLSPAEAEGAEFLSQAMGFTNENLDEDWEATYKRASSFLSARLKEIRQILIHKFREIATECHLFPGEFDGILSNLLLFTKEVFEEDTYHERPYFRGLYFSSAKESGDPNPRYSDLFKMEQKKQVGKEKSFFLVDLFRDILPSDRYLFQPTTFLTFFRRFIKSREFLISSAVCTGLFLLITYAFIRGNVISDPKFPKPPWAITKDNLAQNLREFARFHSDIEKMHELNRGWLLPKAKLTTFFLSKGLDAEKANKREFADEFDDYTLPMVNQSINKYIDTIKDENKYREFRANYVAYNIFKLLLIEDFLKGKRPTAQSQFSYISEIILKDVEDIPSYGKSAFGDLYCSYLDWVGSKSLLESQRDEVKGELQSLFETGGSNLDWLTTPWVHDTPDVTLANFWNLSETATRGVAGQDTVANAEENQTYTVSGAFTLEGRNRIKEFIKSVEDVSANSEIFAKDMATFWSDYNQRYYQAWANLITNFDAGCPAKGGMRAQQALASAMTTDKNPYINLLDRLGNELQAVSEDPTAPKWVTLTLELSLIRQTGKTEDQFARSGGVGKAVWKLYRGMGDGVMQLTDEDKRVMEQGRREAGKAWQDYLHSLGELKPISDAPTDCFQTMFNEFSGESNTIHASLDNYNTLRNLFSASDSVDLWDNIVKGPWRFLVEYGCSIAGDKLQQTWASEVVNGSSDKVQNFITKEAYPFIKRRNDGSYTIVTIDRYGVPFTKAFVDFLGRTGQSGQPASRIEQEYQVRLSTLPPNVNSTAKTLITEVVLEIPSDNFRWVNINRRGDKVFSWVPATSGDVILTIKFGDKLTLSKTYTGDYPFVKFLRDFGNGRQTFTQRDFSSSERRELEDLNITDIEIFYSFDREGSRILDAFRFGTRNVPQVIVSS